MNNKSMFKSRKTPEKGFPSDWDLRKCGDVVLINPSIKFEKSRCYPFLPMDAIDTESKSPNYWLQRRYGEYSGQKFQANDILFARITPSTEHGKIAHISEIPYNSDRAFGSTELTVLRVNDGSIHSDFLYYFLKINRIRSQAVAMMEGATGRQRVPDRFFSSYLLIPIPPLLEQHRIVCILSNVDETIHKTRQIIGQTQRVKQGLMQTLFRQGIGHTQFKDSPLGKIPEEWGVDTFDEIAIPRKENPPETIQMNYIGLEHIESNNINIIGYDVDGNARSSKTYFRKGDILFGKLRPYLRKVAIAPFNGICSSDIIPLIHTYQSDVSYLRYLLHSKPFFQRVISTMEGSNLPRTSWASMKTILISIPPLNEQTQIGGILSDVDNKLYIELGYEKELLNMKTGLMHSLLTGQVRVKVDT